MTIPAYVIHLARAETRRARAEALCQSLGPLAVIVPATDGRLMSDAAVAATGGATVAPAYPFALSRAEIATFLSHRDCWQRLVDSGLPAALIVEDDVILRPPFRSALEMAEAHLGPLTCIRLPVRLRERVRTDVACTGGQRLFRPGVIGLGMQAQVVSRGAAQRLLETTTRFDRPVDAFLQMRWVHGLEVLSVWPSGVAEISGALGGSTIHDGLRPLDRLRHEILRPLYRASIARHSHRRAEDA